MSTQRVPSSVSASTCQASNRPRTTDRTSVNPLALIESSVSRKFSAASVAWSCVRDCCDAPHAASIEARASRPAAELTTFVTECPAGVSFTSSRIASDARAARSFGARSHSDRRAWPASADCWRGGSRPEKKPEQAEMGEVGRVRRSTRGAGRSAHANRLCASCQTDGRRSVSPRRSRRDRSRGTQVGHHGAWLLAGFRGGGAGVEDRVAFRE